jgi:hypothetical protein
MELRPTGRCLAETSDCLRQLLLRGYRSYSSKNSAGFSVSKPAKVGRRPAASAALVAMASAIRGQSAASGWASRSGARSEVRGGTTRSTCGSGTSCPGGAGDGGRTSIGGGVGARASGSWTSLVASSSITVFVRCCCSTICAMICCCWRNSAIVVSSSRGGAARFRGLAGVLVLVLDILPLPRLRPASIVILLYNKNTHKGNLRPLRGEYMNRHKTDKQRSKLGSLHKDLTQFASWSRHQFCIDLNALLFPPNIRTCAKR